MINKIIDFSIHNKLVISLFTLAIIGMGIWSITKVPIDAVPDITNNQVQVITQAPNLGTEEIEQFITYPVELAMSNLPEVNEIRSISRFGLSVVTIIFNDEVGTYLPRQLVAEKLPEIQEQIPEGFGKPEMGPISTGLGEIYQYTLEVDDAHKDKYDATKLRTLQDWLIRRQMAMVDGVVEVNAFGGNKKQYEIAINPNEIRAIGLTISDVFNALANNNENTGGAYIEKNHQANFIRGEGLIRSISDIENIVVKNVNMIPIHIKDIAKVKVGSAVRYGAFTKDGKGEAVGGMVLMLKDANSNNVIKDIKSRIALIQKSLPEGVKIQPFLDRSALISKTTNTVSNNLLEGGLIVIFILVLLLGNWRGGLIVASTIPLSLLFAFILMNIFNVWANLMSLGAIDFGIIVDGAVIIVEGTAFLIVSKTLKGKNIKSQEKRNKITAKASKNMMNAAFFGQLIILIVFIPILTLEGIEGKMFKPMALTFMFAMIGAMVLCLTYVPMVSSLFMRTPEHIKPSFGDRIVQACEKRYAIWLTKVLKFKKTTLTIATVLFALAAFTFAKMGGEFIPKLDEGDIAFHALLKPGSSLTEAIETTTKIEQIIKADFPEVVTIASRIGVADVPTDPMPIDIADIFVILKPKHQWTSAKSKEELVDKMKHAVSILPGVNYEFTQPIEMRFNELLTGVREDVAIKLFGDDLQMLASKAEEIGKLVGKVKGVADMKVEATTGQPQITIHYNRNKIAQYGLQIHDLNTLIQTAFAGGKAGVIFEGEKRFDLIVRLSESNRKDITDLENLYVSLPSGTEIPLREVANVSYQPGPMQISRENTNRRTYVGINIRNRDVKSVVEEIQEILDAELHLPAGYYIRYGGAFENLERATNKLRTVVPIVLLLIFILIFFALKSLSQTLMIYMAIPLAAIGGVFALWLRDMPFSISAGVGFIVLFGVAVLNGLVMISGLNDLKAQGITDLKSRITEGTRRRIRPIMLTALTDILGFLPMALSTSSGAEVQRPLATVVIGGLLTATFLTLFVLPILYHWVENHHFTTKIKKGKSLTIATVALFFLIPTISYGQNDELPKLSLKEAVAMAQKNHPMLKQQQLEINKQERLKRTSADWGETEIFTSAEEIGADNIVKTPIGIAQSGIAVFSIGAKKKLAKKHIQLAKSNFHLNYLQLTREVEKAWGATLKAKKKYLLYKELDSVYSKFRKAVELSYEVEAISKLEYLAAKNQALQINNQKAQTQSEYQIAIQQLNLWISSDKYYTVNDNCDIEPLLQTEVELTQHPAYLSIQNYSEIAEANYRVARANRLPKLNMEGSLSQQNGRKDYYSYQVGLSIPLFSSDSRSSKQAAKLDNEIASSKASLQQRELETSYKQAKENYQQWKASWKFYREEILPVLKEQRKGALLAYEEGAIDYVGFIQIIKDNITSELEAQEAFANYLNGLFTLKYFTQKINY